MRIKWDNEFKNPWPECGIIEGWGGLLEEAIETSGFRSTGWVWPSLGQGGWSGGDSQASVSHPLPKGFSNADSWSLGSHLQVPQGRCGDTDYLQTAVAAGGR